LRHTFMPGAGINLKKSQIDSRLNMSGMPLPFCHPRRLVAGIHPKRNPDTFPINNVRSDERKRNRSIGVNCESPAIFNTQHVRHASDTGREIQLKKLPGN
jgi:hypothetical protein